MRICLRPFGTLAFGIFCNICSQGTLRHILGSVLVIFELYQSWWLQGCLSTFQKKKNLIRPVLESKNMKMSQIGANATIFCTILAILGLYGLLNVLVCVHIKELVLSYKLMVHMWTLVEALTSGWICLQSHSNIFNTIMIILATSPNHPKLLILCFTAAKGSFTIFEIS